MRRAKIVATIGPASQEEEILRSLILAGVDVARLNFSHGSHADHQTIHQRLRRLSSELNHPVAILQDLQGPKTRLGELESGSLMLHPGQEISLTTQPVLGDAKLVSVDFPSLAQNARPGGRVLIDDGNLELEVLEVEGDLVRTRVVIGGLLKPNKGVNLPGAPLDIPCLTEKDEEDLAFGMQLGVDYVAISFVRTAEDIARVRQKMAELAPGRNHPPVIAKLERPEALANLEAILEASDGVMVARGDLGVEMPPETVPIAQKRIIQEADRRGKLVITATQMLDSMINNPRPTRAEASDVANAIFDGTDAVMLSGETANGKYPLQAVQMMDKIVRQAEDNMHEWGRPCYAVDIHATGEEDVFHLTQAASALARDRNVAALAAFTHSGLTARVLSKARPGVPILAFTPKTETYQRMNLYWGVSPHLVGWAANVNEMVAIVEKTLLDVTPLQPGQQVVLVCGYPVSGGRPANMLLLHTIGR